jgi:hypothetical protein
MKNVKQKQTHKKPRQSDAQMVRMANAQAAAEEAALRVANYDEPAAKEARRKARCKFKRAAPVKAVAPSKASVGRAANAAKRNARHEKITVRDGGATGRKQLASEKWNRSGL